MLCNRARILLPLVCRLLLVVALLSGSHALAQKTNRGEWIASIDAIAQQALKDGPIAGLSVAVAKGSDIILAKGYGYADLENDVPASAQTVYRIGSITKQFTAVAIMQLVEQGKLSLNDELTKFLPDYPTQGHRITAHQLLNHTSGIRSYTDLGPKLFQEQFRLDMSNEQVIDLFKDEPFDFSPGAGYNYNNSGYYLAGVIIEKITGQTYADYVEEHIFNPLGMQASSYCRRKPLVKHRARGYQVDKGSLVNADPISMKVAGAAGGLCSTVLDLVKWQRALAEDRLISRASYKRATKTTSLDDGTKVAYGYGLAMAELNGHRKLGHIGRIHGFTSIIWYYPAGDLTVVVLANTSGSKVNPSHIEDRIARALLGLAGREVKEVALSPEERHPYVGTYAVGQHQVRVLDERGQLKIQQGSASDIETGKTPAVKILNRGNGVFAMANNSQLSLTFHGDGERGSRLPFKEAGIPLYVAKRVKIESPRNDNDEKGHPLAKR